jgi:hypothetical protein
MSMSLKDATNTYGQIVFQTEMCVVRCKEVGTQVHIVCHEKNEAGNEVLPLGYITGVNIILAEPRIRRVK